MIKKHAGRTVHLRDDDALGAVDDKGAMAGHQGHIAHIDFLLLDIAHAPHAGQLVDIPDDQAQRHFQRRRIGNAALLAFFDIIFRFVELVVNEFKRRGVGKILYRKDRLKDFLQSVIAARAVIGIALKKMLIRVLLHFDKVRHFGDLGDPPEIFTQSPITHI